MNKIIHHPIVKIYILFLHFLPPEQDVFGDPLELIQM